MTTSSKAKKAAIKAEWRIIRSLIRTAMKEGLSHISTCRELFPENQERLLKLGYKLIIQVGIWKIISWK